jgi:hypothetical protein
MFSSCECISCKKLLYCVRSLPHESQHFSSPRLLWFRLRPSWFRIRLFFSRPHLFRYRPRPIRYRLRLFIFRPRPFIFRPCLFTFRPCPFRFFRAGVVYIRACRTNVRARQLYVNVCENIVHARRRTVRALDHPVCAGINVFVPEGSRETTAACTQGTISPHPFAVHSVQSPCTWACNYASSCLPCTSWVRTKADFI